MYVLLILHSWRQRKFILISRTRKYVWEYVREVRTTIVMSWYCVHTVCACVHSSCFFRWDIFLFISGRKSGCVCVCALTAKKILFLNHRNRKVVGGAHNVLVHYIDDFAPNLSGVVLCNPFIWFLLLFISIHTHICCLYLLHWNIIQPSP